MLSPWFCEAGKGRLPRSRPIRFSRAAITRPDLRTDSRLWVSLGGVALLARMVEEGTMADVKSARNYFEKTVESFRTRFASDANELILQCRTGQKHDVGTTPGFNGDVERALKSIKVPILYMPSETDLYFPLGDARYEVAFIRGVTF